MIPQPDQLISDIVEKEGEWLRSRCRFQRNEEREGEEERSRPTEM